MTNYPDHYTDIDFGLAILFLSLASAALLTAVVLIIVFWIEGNKYTKRVGMMAIHPDATIGGVTESQGNQFDKNDPWAFEDGVGSDGFYSPYGRTQT